MAAVNARRLVADPLVHFLLLGAGLFGLYAVVSPEDADADATATIEITADDIRLMESEWRKQWRRPPTGEELDTLISERVREEVFYREALAMGLDKGDPAIRRQMAEKILYMFQDVASDEAPTDAQLTEFMVSNPDRYAFPATLSFRHVFFDPEVRAEAEADAVRALAEISRSATEPTGDFFDLGPEFADISAVKTGRLLGKPFAERVFSAGGDGWRGPIESDYGVHLIIVDSRTPARPAELGMVREQVTADFLTARRQARAEAFFTEASERYTISVAAGASMQLASE